jgi:hypothetical protein
MKTRKGFTLLIVIVIIGILAPTMMFYAYSMNDPGITTTANISLDRLQKYDKFTERNGDLFFVDTDNQWWVGFNLGIANETEEAYAKLAARAKPVEIYEGLATASSIDDYTGEKVAWMIDR